MRLFFFFNDTATTEIYTLSLHDALPISLERIGPHGPVRLERVIKLLPVGAISITVRRSEEHTSELQSRSDLVCRLLLEKKKRSISTALTRAASRTSPRPTTPHTDPLS